MAALEQPRRALCLAFLAEQARSLVLLSSEELAPKHLLAPDVQRVVAHVCKEPKSWSNYGSRAPAVGTLCLCISCVDYSEGEQACKTVQSISWRAAYSRQCLGD